MATQIRPDPIRPDPIRPGQTRPGQARSPLAFFALTVVLFVPFPLVGAYLHVPGLPKNAPVTDFVAAFVPAVAALVLVYRAEGADGARRLLRRVTDHRLIRNKIWLLPVVLLPVGTLAATYLLTVLTGWHFQPQPALPVVTMLLFVPVFFLAAAGEELGWSGYVIDPLQQRYGPLGGALVLGVVWWALHVPSIVQSGQGRTLIVLGVFATLALRVLWTWLFNNTGGSVFAMIVLHAVTNFCTAYVPTIPTSANAPVLVALAVLVVLCWGPAMSFPRRAGRTGTTFDQPRSTT